MPGSDSSGPHGGTHPPAGIRASAAYLPELECLRGLAIVLVMLFHADGEVRMPFTNTVGMWPPPWTALILGGHTGVSLFFVLSAFLLSLPFLAEAAGGPRVSRIMFYRRRALRILPLYWTIMLVGGVLSATHVRDLLRPVRYMLFLNSVPSWAPPFPPYTTVTWSLATEVQFYALLPLLPLGLGSARRRTAGSIALLLYLLLYAAFLAGVLHRAAPTGVISFFQFGVLGRGPLFLVGIAAAAIYRRHHDRLRRSALLRPWRSDALLVGCLLALGYLVRPSVFVGAMHRDVPPRFAWHVLEGVLWGAVVLLVLVAPLRLRSLLVNPLLARLGVLSYSLYLLHEPVWVYTLYAVRHPWHIGSGWLFPAIPLWLVGATASLLALATVTYRFVERPFLVRKSRLDR